MNLKLKRRSFLKMTAAASAVALGSQFFSLTQAKASESPKQYVTEKMTWCEMCFWGCGVKAKVVGGKVKKLEGQELCPNNYGKLCAKGNSGIYQLYDPDRLKKPLIRTGKRGEGKFKEVSWDEATSYVSDKLKPLLEQYGAKTASLICHGSGEHAFITLMELIGSENIAIPAYSQCLGSREIGWFMTYGLPFTGHEPVDAEFSKCMMFLGRNVLESLHVGEAQRVINGINAGAKMIYVDPRYTKTAAKADYWLKIKPGTDLALILGMINYFIKNNLYDPDFVNECCIGFEELKAAVENYSLDFTEKETEIPQHIIESICIELNKAMPNCFVHPGRRLTRYGNDVQTVRAIAILNALMGNYEQPGGFYRINRFKIKPNSMCDIEHTEKAHFKRADGAGEEKYPLAPANLGLENMLMNAIKTGTPYPIKALFAYGTNLFQHSPDYEETKKIINNLDLIVTCEIYLNEMALYSDVILPESTYLEREDPISVSMDKYPFIQYRERAIDPLFDTKGAWEISKLLADKLGYKNRYKEIREFNSEILNQLGIKEDYMEKNGNYVGLDFEPYRRAKGEKIQFFTESKKVELYSKKLKELGFDPIPKYDRPKQNPLGQFRLLFGRMSYHTHARTQNNRWLLALHDYEVNVWINTKKAYELGINNKDKVFLRQGEKKSGILTAFVTDDIHPEALFIPHGFGRITKFMKSAYEMQGASDADFCSNDVDPISGASAFHNAFVRIEKA